MLIFKVLLTIIVILSAAISIILSKNKNEIWECIEFNDN